MTGWLVALVSVLSVLVYMTIGTAVGIKMYWALKDRNGHAFYDGAFIAGLLWPIGVWILAAAIVVTAEEKRRELDAQMNAERERMLAQARKELEEL